jgi:hypothetical protein
MRLMIADYYLDSSVLTVASLRMASYARRERSYHGFWMASVELGSRDMD